jgi:hypothetical protein
MESWIFHDGRFLNESSGAWTLGFVESIIGLYKRFTSRIIYFSRIVALSDNFIAFQKGATVYARPRGSMGFNLRNCQSVVDPEILRIPTLTVDVDSSELPLVQHA